MIFSSFTSYYPATVEEINDDGTVKVAFDVWLNTEVTPVSSN